MDIPREPTVEPLEYSTLKQRMPWKPYVLGLLTPPLLYLLAYALLRITGVIYPYYSQGSWEMEGGTGVYVIDIWFLPLVLLEGDFHNHFRWLSEPGGG